MTVIGTRPRLPGPLGLTEWLTTPVRAERLAALRICFAAVLLFDIFVTYLPFLSDYYGPGSLTWPDVFASRFESPYWQWSVLQWLPDTWGPSAALAMWAAAGIALLFGWHAQAAAAVAWALSWSFLNRGYYLHNAGDRMRHMIPLLLMLSPCAAVWSVSARRSAPLEDSGRGVTAAVYVYAWPLRLLFLLMALMYFFNGLYKVVAPGWRDASALHYVLTDVGWSRWPVQLPPATLPVLAWIVMGWEIGFPLWMLIPGTRSAALWLGVLFHVGTGLHLELGMFWLYALCLYLPFVPWEKWADRRHRTPTTLDSRTPGPLR
jgi:hypothetical protein